MAQSAAASLADVYAKLSAARPAETAADRRRFRRPPLELRGRMMDAGGREYDCRTADISPGDLRVCAGADVKVGDRIVFYLDSVGRLEARVVRRINDQEFAAILQATPHKRDKLADHLTFLWARDNLGLEDEPSPIAAESPMRTQITLENGGVIEGEVVDFSLVGMAIRTPGLRPAIGAWVRLGAIDGRVARYFEGGFAIDFG